MNIIIAHGYGHRLLTNGMVESAKIERIVGAQNDGVGVMDMDFATRRPEDMDLSGGDAELIRNMLKHLSFVFRTDEPRVSVDKPEEKEDHNPMAAR